LITSPASNGYQDTWFLAGRATAECRKHRLPTPVFNIVSDRRGGRTAWSATVTIQGQNVAARYWYDGQFLNNAKEDAAEVACTKIRNPSITNSTFRGQSGYGNGSWAR